MSCYETAAPVGASVAAATSDARTASAAVACPHVAASPVAATSVTAAPEVLLRGCCTISNSNDVTATFFVLP
jgi:hypothetical protein